MRTRTLKLALLLLLAIFGLAVQSTFASSAQNLPGRENIVFQNIGKPLTLIPEGDYFRVSGREVLFKLSKYLIVKTEKNVEAKVLMQQFSRAVDASLIYEGAYNKFYRVELDRIQSVTAALNHVTMLPGIKLVQPDVLQIPSEKPHQAPHAGRRHWLHSNHQHKPNKFSNDKRVERINRRYFNYLERIGVQALWVETQGEGVRIAVIDDGFDLNQEHFDQKKATFAFDVENKILDASPKLDLDIHGSKIADVLFSSHHYKQFKGIAPQAEMIALRNPLTWTSHTLMSFQLAMLNYADVINCSWYSPVLMEPVGDVIRDAIARGRDGKGAAVVFAAGNDGREILPEEIEASIEEAIVVGSENIASKRLPRSNYGQSVDLYGFGLRVLTPDVSGEYKRFAGTSLSAAITSGVAALLLSREPELTLEELNKKLKETMSRKARVTKKD